VRRWLINKWHFTLLGIVTAMITTVKPALAGVLANNLDRTIELALNLAHVVLGLQIIIGLASSAVAFGAIARGEKVFSAFGPSLIVFLFGFLASLLLGTAMGKLDRILIYIAAVNGVLFINFLFFAWRTSFQD